MNKKIIENRIRESPSKEQDKMHQQEFCNGNKERVQEFTSTVETCCSYFRTRTHECTQDKAIDAEQDANVSTFNFIQTVDTLGIAAVP